MGLAISTGMLTDLLIHDKEGAGWLRKNLKIVNQCLKAARLPAHVEPEKRGRTKARLHVDSFPYSFLHYLRRAFAYVHEGKPVTPVADDEDPSEDPTVDYVGENFDTHLLCHSDCEGYYVPIDFVEVIFGTKKRPIPGAMLGSSVRLMKELVEVAPAIGVKLKKGVLSNAEAARLAKEDDDSGPFWRERIVWLTLYENARVSIANKSLLVFH